MLFAPPDGTAVSLLDRLAGDSMMLQWFMLGLMAVLFLAGALFAKRWVHRNPVVYAPVSKKELAMGAKFISADRWAKYRNPMREFRRFLQWPSGRQWVKRRKEYNRMMPNGAEVFAKMATNVRQSARVAA